MEAKRSNNILVETVSLAFIILLVYAAASKLLDYDMFRSQLGRSPMLAPYQKLVWMVPIIEIAISVMLALPKYRLLGLYAAFSLMVAFSAYIVTILGFSEYVPCSCGGVLQHLSWTAHLIFNSCFIVLGAFAVFMYPSNSVSV
jgi:hypothetical protein